MLCCYVVSGYINQSYWVRSFVGYGKMAWIYGFSLHNISTLLGAYVVQLHFALPLASGPHLMFLRILTLRILFEPFGVETIGSWCSNTRAMCQQLAKQFIDASRDPVS